MSGAEVTIPGLFMFSVSRVFAGSFSALRLRNEPMVTGQADFAAAGGLPTESTTCSLAMPHWAAVEGDAK
jgi:hypothetical protein